MSNLQIKVKQLFDRLLAGEINRDALDIYLEEIVSSELKSRLQPLIDEIRKENEEILKELLYGTGEDLPKGVIHLPKQAFLAENGSLAFADHKGLLEALTRGRRKRIRGE